MKEHLAGIERLADKNIRNWVLSEHARQRLEKRELRQTAGPFLTISRETGAGGSEIARQVGGRMNWEVLDREIIDYMVDHYGTQRDLVKHFDERRTSWLEEVFDSWIAGRQFTESTYIHRLTRLMLLAANHGNVVIVGRGATFVLPKERGLAVRILAPLEYRVEQMLLQLAISESEARARVEESDRQRKEFAQTYFHRDADDPHHYDLVLNVERLGRETVVNLITQALHEWMKKAGFESVTA